MAQIDPFLYIVLENTSYDPVRDTYDATVKSARDIVSRIFIITQKGSGSGLTRIEWEALEISLDDVTFELTYDSGIPTLSNIPKNVGRYDYNIAMTYVRNISGDSYNGTYRNFFTTNYFTSVPSGTPTPDSTIYSDSLFTTESGFAKPQGLRNTYKFLIIDPCPVEIIFTDTELGYTGNTLSPEYITNPQLLDPTDPNAPGNIPLRLMYSGDNVVAPLASPSEIGTYTVTATALDFNYVGSETTSFVIRNLTNIEAAENAAIYQEKTDLFQNVTSGANGSGNVNNFEGSNTYTSTSGVSSGSSLINSSYASSSNKMTKDEFIETGVLTILEKADIEGLGTIKTLAECAQSLPQRLMMFAAAKIAAFVLSYIPGLANPALGIIKLLTSIMELIEMVKKIMALIEFVKENPWAALNMVLENSGAYDALGKLANEQIAAIQESFPGMTGDVGQFVKDVANGLVDICNLDMSLIKADNTKVPEAVVGFIPATSRQPVEAKGKYDLFQFNLRDALNKDSDKLKKMSDEGDTVGVQEYVSMLTAVHELAYNYHDRIASTGNALGILDPGNDIGEFSNSLGSVYNILGDATNILSSVYPDTASTTATSSGIKKSSGFSVDTLNAGLGSVANTIDGVTAGLSSVTSFAMGETGFSITALRNEFNFGAKEMLKKNPFWSKETIAEYNARVNKIKSAMENNVDAIRNNPAHAKASAGEETTSSSGSSIGGISSLISSASSLIRS
jgi:hypothetical protein